VGGVEGAALRKKTNLTLVALADQVGAAKPRSMGGVEGAALRKKTNLTLVALADQVGAAELEP
jgi:hypothetical protein